MQEIERKFIVIIPPPKENTRTKEEIWQGYFTDKNKQNTRIRKSIITKNKRKSTLYTQTQKKGSGLVREENEKRISENDFLEKKANIKENYLEKTRYHIPEDKDNCELNEFHGKCKGLHVLEKEFTSKEEAKLYTPPQRAGPEITEYKEADNSYLAKYGPENLYKKLNMNAQLLKSELQHTYNTIANHYQQTRKKHRAEAEIILKKIQEYPAKKVRILELGCGSGRFLEYLNEISEKEIFYTGIDFAENLLEYAKKIPNNPNIKAEFIHADMTNFLTKQSQESYTIIVGIASLQHIPTEKERLLCIKHCYKILEYNGFLLLANRSRSFRFIRKHWKNILSSRRKRIQRKLSNWNDIIIPRTDQKKTLPRYYHFFTIPEIKTLLLKSGFNSIQAYYTTQQGISSTRKKSKNTLVIGQKNVYN